MHGYIDRSLEGQVAQALDEFPAVALLGPRQCGKTTLARRLVAAHPAAIYLDLERPSDLRQLDDPELFFSFRRRERDDVLVCLDEIQRAPELFRVLRSILDEQNRNGQLLLLGSASGDLLRQSSESLAGRIHYLELTPLLASELAASEQQALGPLWLRGGFPRSFLAASEEASLQWRESFIRTFLERDLPQLGVRVEAGHLHRLWRMLAHLHGNLLNASRLGSSLDLNHKTVRAQIDVLVQTFMVRLLEPLEANLGKRLVKSPKIFLRDSGVLHALLSIADEGELLSHPNRGESWEGFVIENIAATYRGWEPSFYRTANGAEIDLVLTRGRRRIAIECKASTAPGVARGFWTAIEELAVESAWVIAPVKEPYPLREKVWVSPLAHFLSLA